MTEILSVSEASLKKASELLKRGELVAFPTETVYGLGADGFNQEAVIKIFKAKGRPQDNPLILHIHSFSELEDIAEEISPIAKTLMKKFWPGPITFVVRAKKTVPEAVRAGLSTVAVRMPENSHALLLLGEFGRAVAAPSANSSGKPSPTCAKAVYDDLKGKIPLILDGGDTDIGLESTVLDTTGDFPVILRPGKISIEDLREFFPQTALHGNFEKTPPSPGMKYRHYAPKALLTVYKGEHRAVLKRICEEVENSEIKGLKVGVLCFDEDIGEIKSDFVLSFGKLSDREIHSQRLFSLLRKMDEMGVDLILSVSDEERGIGRAFMNRLEKAAGGKVVYI